MRDTDPDAVRLARAILAEPVLVAAVLAGSIDTTPHARRLCCEALADLQRDAHPAVPALRLAIEATRKALKCGLGSTPFTNFDKFAAKRFLIGSESQLVEQIGRYGEHTGTDHMLLRVQWPGLGQKMVLRSLERLGRVVEQLN